MINQDAIILRERWDTAGVRNKQRVIRICDSADSAEYGGRRAGLLAGKCFLSDEGSSGLASTEFGRRKKLANARGSAKYFMLEEIRLRLQYTKPVRRTLLRTGCGELFHYGRRSAGRILVPSLTL